MSRVTAPAAKIARSISTSTPAVPKSTLLTGSKAASPLSHKYAELLSERKSDQDQHTRQMTTRSSNRPHPAPRRARLMQTFSSTAAAGAQADPSSIDFARLPDTSALEASGAGDPFARIRVPLAPDNFLTQHVPETVDGPLATPEISVVAANPDMVSPVSALTEVEGMGVDGVELRFAHENSSTGEREPGMLTDLWKGLMDDVFGGNNNTKGKVAM